MHSIYLHPPCKSLMKNCSTPKYNKNNYLFYCKKKNKEINQSATTARYLALRKCFIPCASQKRPVCTFPSCCREDSQCFHWCLWFPCWHFVQWLSEQTNTCMVTSPRWCSICFAILIIYVWAITFTNMEHLLSTLHFCKTANPRNI